MTPATGPELRTGHGIHQDPRNYKKYTEGICKKILE